MSHALQQVKIFQGLEATALDAIAQAARQRAVRRETFLFHEGDRAVAFYVLTQGRVKLTHMTPEGHYVLVRFAGPGDALGVVAALSEATYPLSAQTVEKGQVLVWDTSVLARLIERYPRLALNALNLIVRRFQDLQDRYRELATERVERRVARALLRLTRHSGRKVEDGVLIDFPLSRRDLAEMTGTTLFTVSRILSRWDQLGLITAGRERVLVRIPHGLVAIAEDLPPTSPPKPPAD